MVDPTDGEMLANLARQILDEAKDQPAPNTLLLSDTPENREVAD